MDIRLRKRLRQLPTKQNHHTSKESTPLSNHDSPKHPPIPTNRNGPHYRTTNATRIQRHPYNHRSRVFKSRYFPTMYGYHHGTRDRSTIPRPHIPLVRTPLPHD